MRLTKNVMSSALIVFMVMAITSVTIMVPVSAQPELLRAWPKWKRLKLSEQPYQILYAKAKNTGTEGVYAKVEFEIFAPGIGTFIISTKTVFLPPHPPPIKLEAIFPLPELGKYYITAQLYYLYDSDWLLDGEIRDIKVAFTVVP